MIRVTYNDFEIIQIAENDLAYTYSREKIFVGEPEEAKAYLESLEIDTTPIDDYVNGTYIPKEINYVIL